MVSDDFISVLSTLVFFKIGSILLCGIEYIPDLGCHQLQLLEVYEVESVTGQNLITELIWHSAKHGVGSSWRATFNNFLLGILVLKKKKQVGFELCEDFTRFKILSVKSKFIFGIFLQHCSPPNDKVMCRDLKINEKYFFQGSCCFYGLSCRAPHNSLLCPTLSHSTTGPIIKQGILFLFFWQSILQLGILSVQCLICWQYSETSALCPDHDHFQDLDMTDVSYLSPLCYQCNPLTPCSADCMMCGGDPVLKIQPCTSSWGAKRSCSSVPTTSEVA